MNLRFGDGFNHSSKWWWLQDCSWHWVYHIIIRDTHISYIYIYSHTSSQIYYTTIDMYPISLSLIVRIATYVSLPIVIVYTFTSPLWQRCFPTSLFPYHFTPFSTYYIWNIEDIASYISRCFHYSNNISHHFHRLHVRTEMDITHDMYSICYMYPIHYISIRFYISIWQWCLSHIITLW